MGDAPHSRRFGHSGQADLRSDDGVTRPSSAAALYDTYVSTQLGSLHRADRDEFESYARHYRAYYAPHLPEARDARILDLGCGMGHFLYFLKQAGYTNHLGIDIGAEQIAFCRDVVTTQAELVEDSSSYLNAHAQTYDAVVCIDVLEHVDDEELFTLCRGVHSAPPPSGRFIGIAP